jgi:hypothetical protein
MRYELYGCVVSNLDQIMSDKLERTLKEPGVNNFKAVFYTWRDTNNENP